MKQKSRKYFGFTLIELTLSVLIIGLIMPAMFSLYSFIIKSNKEILARQSTIQQGYEFFERLNILMQDYTVDYEEYYNRQMVGCVKKTGGDVLQSSEFERNVGKDGYCTEFTAYGNGNSRLYKTGYSDIYYCSSEKSQNFPNGKGTNVEKGASECGTRGHGMKRPMMQSFGQYAALFKDVKGGTGIIVGSEDDLELGYLFNENVDAIADKDHIQELYLISHDGKNRLYFRRKLDKQEGVNKQYKIQILRLRGFDAGRMHNFNTQRDSQGNKNEGLYDGVIDTWACDTAMGFEPKNRSNDNCTNNNNPGNSVCGAYTGYYLPQNSDDCWIDLTYGAANIFAWNISISPLGDPDLYRAKPEHQINPYMKIMTINGVYTPAISNNSTMIQSIREFKVPLETTINMKDFYRGYSQ